MTQFPRVLILSALAAVAFSLQIKGQSTAQPDGALKDVLLKRGDQMMSAWKKHDSAGIASTFAPEFVYVGGGPMVTGVDATISGLLSCTVTSY